MQKHDGALRTLDFAYPCIICRDMPTEVIMDFDFGEIIAGLIINFIGYLVFDFLADDLFGWWPLVLFRWVFLIATVVYAIALIIKIIDSLR